VDGTTISVPAEKVYETGMELAGEGAAGRGVGFEIFDKTSFGVTDFVQKVNYRRALQESSPDDLSDKGVDSARCIWRCPRRAYSSMRRKARGLHYIETQAGKDLSRAGHFDSPPRGQQL
jgi:flagellar M-ring protein FliF